MSNFKLAENPRMYKNSKKIIWWFSASLTVFFVFFYSSPILQNNSPPRFGSSDFSLYNYFRKRPIGNKKVVLFWTKFFGVDDFYVGLGKKPFHSCPVQECFTTTDRSLLNDSDAVIFHVRDLNHFDLPPHRLPHQRWIFFLLESPLNTPDIIKNLTNFFNWTMTYRMDSDIYRPYSVDIPFWELQLSGDKERTFYRQLLPKKTKKVAWFVSNCFTSSRRERYVDELQKYTDVDVFGSCSTRECKDRDSCYEMLSRDYKFYLAFENSLCRDYVTEKFFNALRYSVVPIVYGSANYSAIVDKEAFIDILDYASPKDLAEYLNALAANDSAYARLFDWRKRSVPVQHQSFCQLCNMLNDNTIPAHSYQNIHRWWFKGGRCVYKTNKMVSF